MQFRHFHTFVSLFFIAACASRPPRPLTVFERTAHEVHIRREVLQVTVRALGVPAEIAQDTQLLTETRFNPITVSATLVPRDGGGFTVRDRGNGYANWHTARCVVPYEQGNVCPIESPPAHVAFFYLQRNFHNVEITPQTCETLVNGLDVIRDGTPQELYAHSLLDGSICEVYMRDRPQARP